jgi:hypothetical protein
VRGAPGPACAAWPGAAPKPPTRSKPPHGIDHQHVPRPPTRSQTTNTVRYSTPRRGDRTILRLRQRKVAGASRGSSCGGPFSRSRSRSRSRWWPRSRRSRGCGRVRRAALGVDALCRGMGPPATDGMHRGTGMGAPRVLRKGSLTAKKVRCSSRGEGIGPSLRSYRENVPIRSREPLWRTIFAVVPAVGVPGPTGPGPTHPPDQPAPDRRTPRTDAPQGPTRRPARY